MDDKIGKVNETWPEVTVTGRAYTRPCTTVAIGNGHFVVLDTFMTEDGWQAVEMLRKTVNQSKGTRRAKREESSEKP